MTIDSNSADHDVRFRATFEQAAIGMAHVDPAGRWLEANRQLCEIVGYSPEELTLLTLRDLTHPDDLNADLECVRRVLSDNIRAYSLKKRYLRKDGTPVWTDLTSALVRDEGGSPRYFIKIVRLLSVPPPAEVHCNLVLYNRGRLTTVAQAAPPDPGIRRPGPIVGVESTATRLEDIAHDLNDLLFVVLSYAELSMNAMSQSSPVGQDLRELQRAALRAHELSKHLVRFRER